MPGPGRPAEEAVAGRIVHRSGDPGGGPLARHSVIGPRERAGADGAMESFLALQKNDFDPR
ncbi:hypothetical protein P405_26235 [Streptomyces sp. FR-008]|nr:hypothetical protein SFR_0072 [Streptomyces sp. FR-008]KAF0789642.1 hypothetical protein P405_26235 [Streptomyces sp. FR-008]